MKRLIENKLLIWKNQNSRKPLLLNGIRQVGKTWSVRDFGEKYFDNFVYVNFDIESNYSDVFIKSKDPKKILFELSILLEKKIDPSNTLIFFDEIQECNEALNSLKYFNEDSEDYFIIGAGSYLGIALSKGDSFPVGNVELIELKPMIFKEYLMALDQNMLVDYIESISSIEAIPESILNKLSSYLLEYFVVGGMPEVVKTWLEFKDVEKISSIQNNIINAYFRDFSKYPPAIMVPKIIGIWNSIVSQLSRENRKFKYSDVKKSARSREYENALQWLICGNYLIKTTMVNKYKIPLKSYEVENRFKIYMPDIGLLRKMADYPASSLMNLTQNENIPFKGAMTENFVLQELTATYPENIYYWANDNYEIDFTTQFDDIVLPIEVKAGQNVRSKSMTKVLDKLDMGIRFSMKNLAYDGKILNIPLALISEFPRLFKYMVLAQKTE